MKTQTIRTVFVMALLAIATSCSVPQTEERPKQLYTIAQFMDIEQITGGDFSPDDSKILVSSKKTGIYNAYEIDLKTNEKKTAYIVNR